MLTRPIGRLRAGVVVEHGDAVALIERHRAGAVYFVFPGGGVEPSESPEAAAVREAYEELGIRVVLGPLLAEVRFSPPGELADSMQRYYRARWVSGEFGTGTGPEYQDADGIAAYIPKWVPRASLAQHDVRPRALADALAQHGNAWPAGWVLRLLE